MQKEKKYLPMNLQLFAEPNPNNQNDGGDDVNNNTNNNSDGEQNGNQGQNNNTGEKTFTQAEVNGMMAKEKNEGKRSILKSLGFKDEEEARKTLEDYNKYLESKKTEDEKRTEALKNAKSEKDEALKRAMEAESKLACYNAGVSKEYIDDVMIIASNKVSDEKTLDKVLEEMKKDKKYSSFFGENSSSSGGTGSNAGHSSQGNNLKDNYGERLAKQTMANQKTKSSFFND